MLDPTGNTTILIHPTFSTELFVHLYCLLSVVWYGNCGRKFVLILKESGAFFDDKSEYDIGFILRTTNDGTVFL